MFGACLPMIVTLVIFFLVFGAFSTYFAVCTFRLTTQWWTATMQVQMYVKNEDNATAF